MRNELRKIGALLLTVVLMLSLCATGLAGGQVVSAPLMVLAAEDSGTDLKPATDKIRVSKKFYGFTKTEIESYLKDFKITVATGSKIYILKLNDGNVDVNVSGSGVEYKWTLEGLGVGKYQISESGYSPQGSQNVYEWSAQVTKDGVLMDYTEETGVVETEIVAAQMTNLIVSEETSNSENKYTVVTDGGSNVLFAANNNKGSGGILVFCKTMPSESEQLAIENAIRRTNWKDAVTYYEIPSSDTTEVKTYNIPDAGLTVTYNPQTNEVEFPANSNWNKVKAISYDMTEQNPPDLFFENTYELQTAPVTIEKQVTGNMGDVNKPFGFTVVCDKPMGEHTVEGGSYTLSEDKKTATFTLTDDGKVILQNVPIGSEITVTENADDAAGYTTTITAADGTTIIPMPYTVLADGNYIKFTNEKEVIPDTGILLDSLPYVLILLCVVGIGVFVFIRKRRNSDDD